MYLQKNDNSNIKNKLNLLALFCITLVLARMLYAQNIKLIFLIWNLFLAWIPYISSRKLAAVGIQDKPKFYSLLALCILFLPNAIYLVTDLIHLKPREIVPLWFDVVILFSYGVMGLIYSTMSLIQLEKVLSKLVGNRWILPSFIFLAFVSGFGVYMGRELRWNSWDAIIHPMAVILDCGHKLIHPMNYPAAYGFTLIYGAIQFLFWYVFRNISLQKNS